MRKIFTSVFAIFAVAVSALAATRTVSSSAEFESAWATASSGDVIQLTNDIFLTNTLWLGTENLADVSRSLEIDLNGYGLTLTATYGIMITHGELKISNSDPLAGRLSGGSDCKNLFYLTGSTNKDVDPSVDDANYYTHLEIAEGVTVTQSYYDALIGIFELYKGGVGQQALTTAIPTKPALTYITNVYATSETAAQSVAHGVRVDVKGTVNGTKYGIKVNGNLHSPNARANAGETAINFSTANWPNLTDYIIQTTDVNYSPFVHIHHTGRIVVLSDLPSEQTKYPAAIYASGYARWKIEGSAEGCTGAIIKSGEVDISDATIVGTGSSYLSAANAVAGNQCSGSAIAIAASESYEGDVNVSISGDSEISASNGYAVDETVVAASGETQVKVLTITGGTFDSGQIFDPEYPEENVQGTIMISGQASEGETSTIAVINGEIRSTGDGYDIYDAQSLADYLSDGETLTNIRFVNNDIGGITMIVSEGAARFNRLYCRMTYEWWTAEDAAVGAYAYANADMHNAEWPGERMNKVEGADGLWYLDVDTVLYKNIIFTRINGSGDITDWGAKTADLQIPIDGKNLYTITSAEAVWGDPGVEGEWSVYDITAGAGGETITGYSVVGMYSLFGAAWDVTDANTEMMRQEGNIWTYQLPSVHLRAYQLYEYKVVANHSWTVSVYPQDANYSFYVSQSGTYSVDFVLNTYKGASATPTLISADENSYETKPFSNYIALINHTRQVECPYSGKDDTGHSQYLAHVQLSAGDTLFIRDKAENVDQEFNLEEYGAYTQFTPGGTGTYQQYKYAICQQAGCYDVFFKNNHSLFIGTGTTDCSEGDAYDGSRVPTAQVRLWATSSMYGNVSIDGEEPFYSSLMTAALGSTITLEAFPNEKYQFLRWMQKDYSTTADLHNPWELVVTGDTVLYADFGALSNYPVGVLVNRKKFIRSTFNDGVQLIVRAQLEVNDTIELYFTNDNIYFMAELEQYGEYAKFSGGVEQGYLICNTAGCYDIYFKLEDGITQSLYIGEGTVCSSGVDWTSPTAIAESVCYLIGKDSSLGAWDLAQAQLIPEGGLTLHKPAGLYQFKLVPQTDSWEKSYGYASVNKSCSSENITRDADNNIVVLLEEEGDITISFNSEGICVTGVFGVANTNVHLTTGVTPQESGAVVNQESGDYLLETEIILQASITHGGWMFDQWSDGNRENPRVMALTRDTTLIAQFSPGEFGLIVNGNKIFRGTYTGRVPEGSTIGQFRVSANLQDGDKIKAINLFHDDNSQWIPQLEEGGLSANFSVTDDEWICNVAGCYDLYLKIAYGQQDDMVYIGVGEDCTDGEVVNTPCEPIASGVCGVDDNLTWEISCDSVFTITGTGAMQTGDDEKWYDHRMAIKKVVIGDGITDLVSYAFREAENIKEVIIGEGVTKIGNSAFWGCSAMQTLVLPSTLDTIEDQGFRSCAYLQKIDLPASVRYLGDWAFAYCYIEIDSIICRATTPPACGEEPFYNIDTSTPLYVPAGSEATYRSAEVWKNFSEIRALPECTIASGECGAQGDNVTWTLTCDSIMYIRGVGAMATYSTNSTGQAPWAGYGLQIRDIIIEEGITSLSAYGFYNAGSYTNGAYNNVRSVTIPSTVGKVVNNNFYQCPLLTVTINSDTIVGQSSYSSSSTLQNIFGAQVRQYIIGDSVKSIASAAFRNQSADSLRSVILPEGILSIGTWAFGYLENLDSITLPSTLQTIDADAFYGSGLKAVTIPAGVTTMGGQAFQNCDKLTSVTFEEGLTVIGTSAFTNCTALPEITIPASMQTISSGAFTGCTNLTKLTVLSPTWAAEDKSSSSTAKQLLGGYIRQLIIGEQVTALGKYAFSGIDSLRTVSLPSTLMQIGNSSFSSCSALTKVICNALTPPSIQSNSFTKQDTLIVPCEAKSQYKVAQYWQNFSKVICEGNDLSEKVLGLNHTWTFIMLPTTFGMNAGDVVVEGEVEWATYNGSVRAMSKMGWETYAGSDVHMCSNALIVRAVGDTATITFNVPQQAVNMAETSVPLFQYTSNHVENANWNFVGNPYPYPYDTQGFADAGIETITIWNGTGYESVSPGLDSYILQPFESFFIQLPETGAPESLNFVPLYIVQ